MGTQDLFPSFLVDFCELLSNSRLCFTPVTTRRRRARTRTPRQNLSEGGGARRLKFDAQTSHGLLAEFMGVGVCMTHVKRRTKTTRRTQKKFWTENFFWTQNCFWTKYFFHPKNLLGLEFFRPKIFFRYNFFRHKIFLRTKIFSDPNFLVLTQN